MARMWWQGLSREEEVKVRCNAQRDLAGLPRVESDAEIIKRLQGEIAELRKRLTERRTTRGVSPECDGMGISLKSEIARADISATSTREMNTMEDVNNRNLRAVAHNLLCRWDALGPTVRGWAGEPWKKVCEKVEDLRAALSATPAEHRQHVEAAKAGKERG